MDGCDQLSGVNKRTITDHVSLYALQGTGDGGGAPLWHVLAQALLYVPVELLEWKKTVTTKKQPEDSTAAV